MSRTAIIAVHGVGSPPRFETARGVADLLTQYGSSTAACSYPSFHEQLIKIPTLPLRGPVAGGTAASDAAAAGAREPFLKRLLRVRPGTRDRTTFESADTHAAAELDVAFMRGQLLGREGSQGCKPYNTIEIVGSRLHKGNGQRIEDEVRIYEMHWADLARVGGGLLRLLGGIYQLILHIAHLGRKTLDIAEEAALRKSVEAREQGQLPQAASAQAEALRWKSVAFWHAMTLRFFTIAVPVCTLLLLGCVLLFLPDAVAPRRRLVIAVVVLELVLLGLIGIYTYFRKSTRHAASVLVAMIMAFVAGGIAVVVLMQQRGAESPGVVALNFTTAALVLLLYGYLVNRYDAAAPGSLSWGAIGLVIVIVGMASWGRRFVSSAGTGAGEGMRFVALAGFQFSYVLLMLAWILIWLCSALTFIGSLRLRLALRSRAHSSIETRERAGRALWTAKVTLAISLFGFLMTSLVSYEAVNILAWKIHGSASADGAASGFNIFPRVAAGGLLPLIHPAIRPGATTAGSTTPSAIPCKPQAERPYDPAECAKRFFDDLVAESGTVGLPLALGTAGIAFLLVSWFVILIAVTSVKVPKSGVTYASHVGVWMTEGFQWLRRSGSVLVFGLGCAIAVGLGVALAKMLGYPLPTGLRRLDTEDTKLVLTSLAIAVLASSATLAAARARLQLLTSRARPAIGILLDVDNYLRESPAHATPRALIAERFASLLRHVVEKRDGDKPYFHRIVIVAHSQGTVISADFLRFLTMQNVENPDISDRDVRLITMGSPLRQLYAAHFPHLYRWIDRTDYLDKSTLADDDGLPAARGVEASALIEPSHTVNATLNGKSPSPLWLRVRQWVNLYTAGDYVGRPLWQNTETEGVWKYDSYDGAAVGHGRRERCLGDGTHTRYWTSLDVAQEIDEQIAVS